MADANAQSKNTTMNTAQLSDAVRELQGDHAAIMDAADEARSEARAAANQVGATVRPEPKGEKRFGKNKGEPRMAAFQYASFRTRQAGNTTVKVRHLVEIGAFIGAWRGLARLLESRVTLPVGIYADIIAGTVGLVVCETGIYWTSRRK